VNRFATQGKEVVLVIWDNARLPCEQAGENLAARAQSHGAPGSTNRQSRRAYHPVLVAYQELPLSTALNPNGSMASGPLSNLLGF
jgi:hypothetical protein